jgi:hypothetical protein
MVSEISKTSGEKLDNDIEEAVKYRETSKIIVDEGQDLLSQIYNADKSGLFHRTLASRTYIARNEKMPSGRKSLKYSITFMPFFSI